MVAVCRITILEDTKMNNQNRNQNKNEKQNQTRNEKQNQARTENCR